MRNLHFQRRLCQLIGVVLVCASPARAQGIISTVAGNGTGAFSGDGGPATNAGMYPVRVAVDAAGNLYITDSANNRVRKVTPGGTITTVAGTRQRGLSGDGGPATSAMLNYPSDAAVDAVGNLYIAEDSRIRKVTPSGTITTVAGAGEGGYSGDGGRATSAQLAGPKGLAVDAAGNLYIADSGSNRIRKVTPSGTITTVAGNGEAGRWQAGFSGDGGPATSAMLDHPNGVAVDAAGNLYIAGGGRVRRVTPGGTITTVAGNGRPALGMGADGGPATSTSLGTMTGMAVDAAGNLYIAQFEGYIRKVTPGGTITTVVGGNGNGFSGDGGLASSAGLRGPSGVAVDVAGNLYIADKGNNRIRKVATKAPFTVNHVIKFAPGTERQRAALKQMAGVGGIVDGDFVTANEDLNDDGSKEIIVMSHSSLNCGTGGCTTVVLQKRPNGIAIIFEQNLFEPLAVTNEKIGIYRALATADDNGGIVIGDKRGTPMFGKQLVYPMNGH